MWHEEAVRIYRWLVKITAFGAVILSPRFAYSQQGFQCPTALQDSLSISASAYLSQEADAKRGAVVLAFYKPCKYSLAWSRNGKLTSQALAMIRQFENAESKGLRPADYSSSRWPARLQLLGNSADSAAASAQFDIDLTVDAMRYVSDLVYGRSRPVDKRAGYETRPDDSYIASIIWSQIAVGDDVPAATQKLEPTAPGYLRTERALQTLQAAIHNLHDVNLPAFPEVLRPGNSSPYLPVLVERLRQLGDLPASAEQDPQPTIYTGVMLTAVQHFQSTHGLDATGTIDALTWKQLAVPLSKRANQLALTLERWRWVPHTFSEPPIVINIPEYRVRAYDDRLQVAFSMAIIVGRAANRKTPVLQAKLTQVTFHPYWNVPRNIQVHEIAPHVAGNPVYLSSHGYQVVAPDGSIIKHLDDSAKRGIISGSFRIRQTPGAQNALGGIKFSFPNVFNVYMHGTPQQSLFRQSRRDFSHGCIRVEDPVTLAAWVLRHQEGWSKDRIHESVRDPRTVSITLAHPIPVLVVYGTGFAAEDGSLRFLDDVYGYDRTLQTSLDALSLKRERADSISK